MDATDLRLKEYEILQGRIRDVRGSRDRIVTVASSLVLALITFTVRGDLPQATFLLSAAVVLVGWAYISALSHREACIDRSARISTVRLRRSLGDAAVAQPLFDITEREELLLYGNPRRITRKVHHHALTGFLLCGYLVLCFMGSTALSVSSAVQRLVFLTGVALAGAFGYLSWDAHRQLKRRFADLLLSEAPAGPDAVGPEENDVGGLPPLANPASKKGRFHFVTDPRFNVGLLVLLVAVPSILVRMDLISADWLRLVPGVLALLVAANLLAVAVRYRARRKG